MIVTLFKNIKETSTPFEKDVSVVLHRIKNGVPTSKTREIVSKIRKEKDKEVRTELKKQLPAICFSGRFSTRKADGFIEHSGLICLDFDSFQKGDFGKWREKLKKDKYVYCVFVSPSGNGLKVLVKIPKDTKAENHVSYFDALAKHFDCKYLDKAAKDIARVCYESYDENIYINEDSEVFTDVVKVNSHTISESEPLIRVESQPELLKLIAADWERAVPFEDGQRNHSMFYLANLLCEYGIKKGDAKSYCSQFIREDFPEREITDIIDRIYNTEGKFNTRCYEDTRLIDVIKAKIRSGNSRDAIIEDMINDYGMTKERIKKVLDRIDKESSVSEFWAKSNKGAVRIVNHKFKAWLEKEKGFFKFYPEGSDHYIFVRRESNLIDNTTTDKVKDVTLNYLHGLEDISIYEHITSTSKLFKDDYLNMLGNCDLNFKADKIDCSYLYYRNCAIEVGKDYIKEIDYLDLDGYVWKQHVINRDFYITDSIENDFKKLIFNVADKDPNNVESIESAIGYMMHSYKNRANNVAVVLNDADDSENPEGGTGKGIFINALYHIKRTAMIDGKTFSFDKSFPYQTVSADTQILVFDDINKRFDFERLFSLITEGITLEKKNKDAIKIPVDRSPKILISTNYALKGDGSSFERRKFELEFAKHYNKDNTPLDEFGRLLFDEWSEEEWMRFNNYMIHCLQLYLNKGLVKQEHSFLKTNKLIAKVGREFYDWSMDDNIPLNIRIDRKKTYNDFIEEYEDRKKYVNRTKFMGCIKAWAEFNGYKYITGKSNGKMWSLVDTGEGHINTDDEEDNNDVPF